ncbi:MAG: polysaccharide biosynthesis tyrosine autokinase [Marinovum sp.]|nr:polysaccharide biosynthesis tyrosine autokinase [Marinovum sp.]
MKADTPIAPRHASVAPSDVLDLGKTFATLWRGKLFIIFCMFVTIFAGGYYAYVAATPMFTSTAVVMLNAREEQVLDLESVVGGLGSDTSTVNTEVEVLRSRSLLRKVVADLNLVDDPEFNTSLQPPSSMSVFRNYVQQQLGMKEASETRTEEQIATRREEATIDNLLGAMSVRNIPQSLVFTVSLSTTSPEKSAQIADSLVEQYILNQLEVKFAATEQATSWLTERVTELQVSLEEAESKVKNFRSQTDLVSPEALEVLETQVKDIRARIEDAMNVMANQEARLVMLEAASTPESFVAAAQDRQLEQLLSRINQPSIQEAFDRRREQILARTRLDIDRNSSQIPTLEQSQSDLEAQISRQSADLITLQQLTREAEASRLLYEHFLTRLKETSAQQGIQQADSRLLSHAVVPSRASWPRKRVILVLSAVFGIAFGSIIVLLRELRQNTYRTVEDLEQTTGIAVFGQVPKMPGRKRAETMNYIKNKPTSAAAEAVRNLRTSIMLSNVDRPPKVVLVSSSVPGEGKTTLAFALSQNLASMGKRVVLVEGDIRRRVFSVYLENEKAKGLVSVLSGDSTWREVMTHSSEMGIDVLRADKGPANPADLFSSESFAGLIDELRAEYHAVIIDQPPVLVVPDARITAQHVDSVLYVVAWDRTDQDQVQAGIREFASVGRPVTGLVLNQINPRGMKRYGYGGKYGAYAAYGSKYYVN